MWLTKNYPWKWDMVVIDESSAFKNRNKRWQALKRFTPMLKSCVLLSGTPSPKGYEDLWSQMYLLDGGIQAVSYHHRVPRQLLLSECA